MTDPENLENLSDEELLAWASPRPWYFDGWDIFTTGPTDETGGHRLVVPLPNTVHPSQRVSEYDAELIVRAVNAYEKKDVSAAVKELCWRVIDLARSRKTGALQALMTQIAGPPPQERPRWGEIKNEVVGALRSDGEAAVDHQGVAGDV